jgi:hypothetical protein
MPIYVACPSAILLSSLRTQELAFSRRIWNHPETGLGGPAFFFACNRIHGKVRFFGENLGVTNDLAKRIAKLLRKNFGTKPGD